MSKLEIIDQMPKYKCSECDYTAILRSHVKTHINKQKGCSQNKKEIIEVPIIIECEFCNKIFSSAPNLKRHQIDFCRKKDLVKNEKIKELEDKIIKLQNIIIDNKEQKNEDLEEKEDENYIYLIKLYPYSDNIYKVGRTKNILERLATYKRYKIVTIMSCEDDVKCEKELIEIYKKETMRCTKMGNEYFIGKYDQMKTIMREYFNCIVKFD